jgi:hypothetical protein
MGVALTARAIEVDAPADLRSVIAGMGRTEDVKFSPDNRRLAIAGFGRDTVFVVDVVIAEDGEDTVRLSVTGVVELSSSSLREPHGLCFIDRSTLVVANRAGEAPILKVPPPSPGCRAVHVVPVGTIRADHTDGLASPGSVAVVRIASGLHEVLVCNNYADNVSRHVVDTRNGYRVVRSEVMLAAGLDIPDGVAVSADHRWLAISNHNTHRVLLFRNRPTLCAAAAAVGALGPAGYPHGLCFTPDGHHLLVADAGAPSIHVFTSDDADWSGLREPASTMRVMDDDCFLLGRYNPQEGGPKGLDVDRTGRVLVLSSEHQPLAAFDLRDIVPDSDAGAAQNRDRVEAAASTASVRRVILRELERGAALDTRVEHLQHEVSECATSLARLTFEKDGLQTELARLHANLAASCAAEVQQRLAADDFERQLAAVRASRSWRATAALRWLGTLLRAVVSLRPRGQRDQDMNSVCAATMSPSRTTTHHAHRPSSNRGGAPALGGWPWSSRTSSSPSME